MQPVPKLLTCEEHQRLSVGAGPDARLTLPEAMQLLCVQGGTKALSWADRDTLRTCEQVGVVSGAEVRLEILPKISGVVETRNVLVRMLATAWRLRIEDGELAQMEAQKFDILEIVVRLFAKLLLEEVRRGLSRHYVQHREDLSRVRGRLDAGRQYTHNLAYPHRLACVFDELTANTKVNRLLLCAADSLARWTRVPETKRLLGECAGHFNEVDLVTARVALRERAAAVERRWQPVVKLARLLLEGSYQATQLGVQDGVALLFDMNRLFEEYVARLVGRAAHSSGYDVTMQGPSGSLVADEHGKSMRRTRPDIHVCRGGRVLVLDTKWKELQAGDDLGVSSEDLYQMHAYQHVYGCSETVLIYPSGAWLPANAAHISWQFAGGKPVRMMGINLSKPEGFIVALEAMLQAGQG